MLTVNILEAKTQLSKLVESVELGTERSVIIARNGRPVAQIVALPLSPVKLGVRLGMYAIPDNIDLDNDLIAREFGMLSWCGF